MEQGKHSEQCIVVRPQVCSLFLLKALELGIFLGLPVQSAGYTFFVAPIVPGLQTYLFYNPYFLSSMDKCFHATVSFLIVFQ